MCQGRPRPSCGGESGVWMRIGTWNTAGRWSPAHAALLVAQDCDVWLLTEVSDLVRLDGYAAVVSSSPMVQGRAWAGVVSRRPLDPLPDPHGASAAAVIEGDVFCSSVLPWRSCGTLAPWSGEDHSARTQHAVDALMAALPAGPLVWGGDWNHSMSGAELAGSKEGREVIIAALDGRGLVVPTRDCPHQPGGCLSIDHIAVPEHWDAAARVVSADVGGSRLSDHDAYVVDVV